MPKPDVERVYRDLHRAAKKQRRLHRRMNDDHEFALGKQWKDEDVDVLKNANILPITSNQIKPLVKIITGIERQSRSDYIAYPEGKEDHVTAEIVTRLLKNVVKRAALEKKQSDMFKEGTIGGLSYLEPYIDYTYDLLNGEMKFRKINADRVFYSPDGEEYDLSDRSYVIKMTYGLSRDQLVEMFQDESKVDQVGMRTVKFEDIDNVVRHIQSRDYKFDRATSVDDETPDGYDLIEYYYKDLVDVYYVADRATGEVFTKNTKAEATALIDQFVSTGSEPGRWQIIKKKVPEIRLKQVVGDVEFSDEVAWSYPRWKTYPIFPFYFERMTVNISDDTLLIQGVVCSIKDQQIELNKSRTLEMRHINSSVNSGFMAPKGAFDDKSREALKQFGSSPGFYVEYDPSKTGGVVSPETMRIRPADIPAGHMSISNERINEIKASSGVNPDLLANDSQSQSGRAILLKQRQGLVMVQESLDNYGETRKNIGKFILTQLGEIFTVESAIEVLGGEFIKEIFNRPQIDADGNIVHQPNGQMAMAPDKNEVYATINRVLNDSSVGKYDVSIGEGTYSETVKLANYAMLMDMVSKGIPIPPEMVIEDSMLGEAQKKRIIGAIEAARQSAAGGK